MYPPALAGHLFVYLAYLLYIAEAITFVHFAESAYQQPIG